MLSYETYKIAGRRYKIVKLLGLEHKYRYPMSYSFIFMSIHADSEIPRISVLKS